MSAGAVAWALDQDLDPPEKLLLVLLADSCDNDGQGNGVLPSEEWLLQKLGTDPSHWLGELVESGLITLGAERTIALHLERE